MCGSCGWARLSSLLCSPNPICEGSLPGCTLQGLEAGQAEGRAELQEALAQRAEAEGRLAGLEDRLEALAAENAQLESLKVPAYRVLLAFCAQSCLSQSCAANLGVLCILPY